MPQGLASFHTLAECFNLGIRSGGGIGSFKTIAVVRHEILVVPVLEDRLKDVVDFLVFFRHVGKTLSGQARTYFAGVQKPSNRPMQKMINS